MKFPKIDVYLLTSMAMPLIFATITTLFIALCAWISWWLIFLFFFALFSVFFYPAIKLESETYGYIPSPPDILETTWDMMTEEDDRPSLED